MSQAQTAPLRAAALLLASGSLLASAAHAATYTSPRQLVAGDIYDLPVDSATGDEATTCPKTDSNTGAGGDSTYYQRTNVARAHVGGCGSRYWFSSNFQSLCTDVPPVNTCGAGPCVDEPSPTGPQYVDYAPPFGSGASQLTPGRYRIIGEYRNTTSRATYPAEYIVHHTGGTTTVLKSQLDGVDGSCPSFDIGYFDMNAGNSVRINDTGGGSITFNHMRFQLVSALGGAPLVSAGADQTVILPASAGLSGAASDDGQPAPLTATWSQVSGPGTATFVDSSSPSTSVSFDIAGSYVLRLTAFDGTSSASDDVNVTVLPANTTLTYSTQYEFDNDPRNANGVIDANNADANGNGILLIEAGAGGGLGATGSGISGGVYRCIDNSISDGKNWGFYWAQAVAADISFTLDLSVKVNSGCGPTNKAVRRSMSFSAGNNKNIGLRLNTGSLAGNAGCSSLGSVLFSGSTSGVGTESCINFNDGLYHRIRVSANAATTTGVFHVYDLDNQNDLTGSVNGNNNGSSGSWPTEINGKGGFTIGPFSGSNTGDTDFQVEYARLLLGVAVESATTPIRTIGQCHTVGFDFDGDGDVDMNDYGAFQACYAGPGQPVSSSACQCFDQNGDNAVDEFDFQSFRVCAATSGAGVPANATICNGS